MKHFYNLLFLLTFNAAFGQTNTFFKVYNNFTAPNSGSSAIQTYDGNYLITLAASQPLGSATIFKVDSSGTIDLPNIHTYYCAQGARSLINYSDSNYIFLSSRLPICSPGNAKDLIIYKVNQNGDTLWSKAVTNTLYDEAGRTITKLKNENFIIGGTSDSIMNLWKIDSLGNLIWSKSVSQNVQYVNTVIEDSDSNLIVAGSCNGGDGWAIVKINSTADSVFWVKKNMTNSGNGIERINSVLVLDNGNYFVAGYFCQLFNCGLAILERNTGNILWSDSLHTGLSADFTSDGNIIVSADSFILGTLRVIDQSGNLVWSKSYAAPVNYMYEFRYVKTALDGGYLVTGDRWYLGNFSSLIPFLLKTDSLGDFLSTGINEITKSEDYVFSPNPLTSYSTLTFSNPAKEKFVFTLYDITGRMVSPSGKDQSAGSPLSRGAGGVFVTTDNKVILEKGNKPPGVYLFNLTNQKTGERMNGKIVVGE